MINDDIILYDTEFVLIQRLVFKHVGITLDDTKRNLVKNRLTKRLHFYGLTRFNDYIRIVQFNRDEAAEMVNQITTNETYFFREPSHFDFLQKSVKRLNNKGNFRVWSAATSLGAEAYSIAMVVDDILGTTQYEVIGTDINTEVLKVAKDGYYPLPWADKIAIKYKKKYCLKGKNQHEKKFIVDLVLKKNVHFQQVNLLERQTELEKFDIIFLRNVLIYFNDEVKKLVIENVIENLHEDGYLIISLTENLRNISISQLKQVSSSIYQKVAL